MANAYPKGEACAFAGAGYQVAEHMAWSEILEKTLVEPAGKRFLVGVPVEQDAQTPFTVALGWEQGLKR